MIPPEPNHYTIFSLAVWIEKLRKVRNFTHEDLLAWEKKETKRILIANLITGQIDKEMRNLFLFGSGTSLELNSISNADLNAIRNLLRTESADLSFAWAIWSGKRERKREISLQALEKAIKEHKLEIQNALNLQNNKSLK